MCTTCGCGENEHPHDHGRTLGPRRTFVLEQKILAKNDAIAARNRGWLADRGVTALNVMSSPGSGKTTLLEKTIARVGAELAVSVVEGDQATPVDAERIRAAGAPAVQINTGKGCHLDADMIAKGLRQLEPRPRSLLFIENVGNLVCPALFDLGEKAKVVVVSVTEGDDKPAKYPHMFRAADVLVLNKIDLLPYVPFDPETFLGHARRLRPDVRVFQLSALRGDGLDAWCAFLRTETVAI